MLLPEGSDGKQAERQERKAAPEAALIFLSNIYLLDFLPREKCGRGK
jgi:hypothetical protein